MKKQLLKHLSNGLLFMLVMTLTSCSPTWKDAQEKLDQGKESDAARIIEELAENGDVKAMDWIINYYRQFNPILEENFSNCNKENYTPSTIMFMEKRAADWENGDLARILTKFYSQSGFRDEEKARKWLDIAATKGDPECMYLKGEELFNKGKFDEGLLLFEKVANLQNITPTQKIFRGKAARELYSIYSDKEKTPDMKKALRYCEIAADDGDNGARYFMAYYYFYGEGVEKNIEKAHRYISAIPDGQVPDPDLNGHIEKVYEAEQQIVAAQRAMDELKRVNNILNNSSWINRESSGVSYRIRFCGNMTLVFERNDLYDNASNYSVKFKYSLNKDFAETLTPVLTFYKYIDYEGVSPDWILENFNGDQAGIAFSVSDQTMKVTGNRMMSGTYTQQTR